METSSTSRGALRWGSGERLVTGKLEGREWVGYFSHGPGMSMISGSEEERGEQAADRENELRKRQQGADPLFKL